MSTMTALVEHALAQLTLAQIESQSRATRIREGLEQWRLQSPEHDLAYQEAVRQSGALDEIAPVLREHFKAPAPARARPRRGQLLAIAFAMVASAACVAGFLEWRATQPLLQERYATGTGQVVTVPLPDGSRIELGARSAVSVTYFRGRRDVGFEQGEARFSVASDKARPFTVATREGKVEVVGTIFTVSDRAGALSLQVEEGRVRFTPVNAGSDAMLLGARDKLTMRHGVADPITRVTVAAAGSWRDGWLTFENEPLAEALAVVNAYRTAPIRIADPGLAGLRLTGSFRATESKELVLALPQILPVDAVTTTDGAVDLVPRP